MLFFRIKQLSKISVVNKLTSLERNHMLLPVHMSVFPHYLTIFYIKEVSEVPFRFWKEILKYF